MGLAVERVRRPVELDDLAGVVTDGTKELAALAARDDAESVRPVRLEDGRLLLRPSWARRACRRPPRKLKTDSSPSDHQRPRIPATSAGGGLGGKPGLRLRRQRVDRRDGEANGRAHCMSAPAFVSAAAEMPSFREYANPRGGPAYRPRARPRSARHPASARARAPRPPASGRPASTWTECISSTVAGASTSGTGFAKKAPQRHRSAVVLQSWPADAAPSRSMSSRSGLSVSAYGSTKYPLALAPLGRPRRPGRGRAGRGSAPARARRTARPLRRATTSPRSAKARFE